MNFFTDQAQHIQTAKNHALPYRGKRVAGVRDEHTGFSHGSISHSNTLDESCSTHFQVPIVSSPHITSKLPLAFRCSDDFELLSFFQLKNWREMVRKKGEKVRRVNLNFEKKWRDDQHLISQVPQHQL